MNEEKLNSVLVPLPYDMWIYLNNLAGVLDVELHKVVLELCELGKSTAETVIGKRYLSEANAESKLLQTITAQAALESLLLLRNSNQVAPEARQAASEEAKSILRSKLAEQKQKGAEEIL
jgi:hypothetical protein